MTWLNIKENKAMTKRFNNSEVKNKINDWMKEEKTLKTIFYLSGNKDIYILNILKDMFKDSECYYVDVENRYLKEQNKDIFIKEYEELKKIFELSTSTPDLKDKVIISVNKFNELVMSDIFNKDLKRILIEDKEHSSFRLKPFKFNSEIEIKDIKVVNNVNQNPKHGIKIIKENDLKKTDSFINLVNEIQESNQNFIIIRNKKTRSKIEDLIDALAASGNLRRPFNDLIERVKDNVIFV